MIDDDLLTALALEADPDAPLAPDARPLPLHDDREGLLPEWYMPAVGRSLRPRSLWQRAVVIAVIGAIVFINALGLCITYGHVTAG